MTATKAPPNGERIAKRLAAAGLCSRRDAERWIADGRVMVNGQLITSPALNVTSADHILVDGQPLTPAKADALPRLFMFHKPAGVLCTARDPQGRPTVFDKLPRGLPRLLLVGRLDLNSEGLLLLTTDGDFAQRLMHPSTGLARTYRVRFRGVLSPAMLARLAQGLTIDGVRYRPIDAQMDKTLGTGVNHWATVTLHEGKNREIRKVFEYLGLPVNRLRRVSYGPFELGPLDVAQLREVPPADVKRLLGQLEQGA